jgi:hypothetical protein
MAKPMQIGLTVEYEDEKPHANLARHYIIQSMETGEHKTVYRHQIFYESPLTSITPVSSNTDYTHDITFSSAQTLNVTRNPLSAMNMFQNATISGGNITFNLVQQQ